MRLSFDAYFVAIVASVFCWGVNSASAATFGGGNNNSECMSHGHCADDLACFTDLKCRDPCTYSDHGLQCGLNAGCNVIHHQPECACLPGFSGDPLRGCENNVRQLRVECVKDDDCPRNRWCFPDGQCRDPCTDTHTCGENQVCLTYGDDPECVCLPGFYGHGTRGCLYNNYSDYCRGLRGTILEDGQCSIQSAPVPQRPVFKNICPPNVLCQKGRPRRGNAGK